MSHEALGRIVAVHGFQVKVELDAAHLSPVRASLDGAETYIRINAYLTFDLGAGDLVLGVITDLYSTEISEPSDDDLTLQFIRPRRIATAQLLGTLYSNSGPGYRFDPGVTILPTLDTPAKSAQPEILKVVLENAPLRNIPDDVSREVAKTHDSKLELGHSVSARERRVSGSFNDLFSRPLAVVGNTGSGKSCSIAHLLQNANNLVSGSGAKHSEVKFIVLDINGEYSKAFGCPTPVGGRQSNRLYFNGVEGFVPIWLMNAMEACAWLSASEQTQEPALVNLWAIAKGAQESREFGGSDIMCCAQHLTGMITLLDDEKAFKKGVACREKWVAAKAYFPELSSASDTQQIAAQLEQLIQRTSSGDKSLGADEPQVRSCILKLIGSCEEKLHKESSVLEQTADKPVYFPVSKLANQANLESAAALSPGDRSIRPFLQGLQLRIQNRLADNRWNPLLGFDKGALEIRNLEDWFKQLGINSTGAPSVTVIDCSMVAHEVLPFVCSIVARVLVELREHLPAETRFESPWVLVLEEAHNYIRPRRETESKGLALSRETFERVAKEGRKFGLSLIVASQRPSDISATVLSQCANFITHRLQNPDDIDHFRKIVPSQSRRLIDQITILGAGEAIVVGSAFNVPSRVQIRKPSPEPSSKSSSPYHAWRNSAPQSAFADAMKNWTGST